jgi:hypothetical protein
MSSQPSRCPLTLRWWILLTIAVLGSALVAGRSMSAGALTTGG